MNREIKFRAWHNGKMLYHNPMMSTHYFIISPDGKVFYTDEPGYVNGKNHDSVIMQYTGLKDKSGKEIYEGDIVKWDDHSEGKYWRVAVVYWDEEECIHCFRCVKNTLHELSTIDGYVFGPSFMNRTKSRAASELIIVGNIYENSELLGKDEEPRSGGMKKGKRKHQNLKTWQGISEKQIKM